MAKPINTILLVNSGDMSRPTHTLKHIPELDGVRGMALILVMVHHYLVITMPANRLDQIVGRLAALIDLIIGKAEFAVS